MAQPNSEELKIAAELARFPSNRIEKQIAAIASALADAREAHAKIAQNFGCDCLKTDEGTIHQINCDEGTKGFRIAAAIRVDTQREGGEGEVKL